MRWLETAVLCTLLAEARPAQTAFGPADVWELFDRLVPAQMEKDHVPGAAVAVVWEGEVVFAEGFGRASLEREQPVSAETTLFRIGSISKVCTALALAREVERAGLALEDEIAPRLAGLAIRGEERGKLRYWHLLTHTAGFDQIGLDRHAQGPADQLTPRRFLEGRLVLVRAPGQVTCYDTYAITLAGELVERLSGQPYAQYMRAELFQPLGMERTYVQAPDDRRGVQAPEDLRRELATGYGYAEGKHVPQPYEYYNTQPASSIDSTALDMARFSLGLLGDGGVRAQRVLSRELLEGLRRPQFRNHPDLPGFTLGFWEEFHGRERALQHGGTMLGFTARLTLFPERRLGLFSACNRDPETGPYPRLHDVLVAELAARVVHAERPGQPPPVRADVDLARLTGSYTDIGYCHTCPDGEGWSWSPFEVQAAGPGELEFWGSVWQASGPLEFRSGERRAIFRTDARGRVSHLCVGNLAYERIGEVLLEATFGPDWREHGEEPLVKRVLALETARSLPSALDLDLPAEFLERWSGVYRTDAGFEVEIHAREGRLWLVVPGRADRRLLYQGKDECRVEGNDALRLVFRGAGDKVDGLTFHDDDGSSHEIARVE